MRSMQQHLITATVERGGSIACLEIKTAVTPETNELKEYLVLCRGSYFRSDLLISRQDFLLQNMCTAFERAR